MADYGVTSTGFKAKRYEEIFADIKTRFKTDLGIDLDRNPDMVSKIITNIITLPIAQSWSNTQTLQSMFDVDKAEGVWLDNLASFYGITRSVGSYPRGRESITVTSPVTIVAEEQFTDTSGNVFINEEAIVIAQSSATNIVFSTTTNNPTLQTSTILVDGNSYSVTGTNPATTGLNGIASLINADGDSGVTASVYDEQGLSYIVLDTILPFENHSFQASANMQVASITGYGEVRSEILGNNSYVEGSVVNAPAYTAIESATNLEPIDGGSGEETDDELRIRIKSTRNTGKATVSAIRSALLALDNVSTAVVLENDTEYQDIVNNIPPKAFKCIVKGGSRSDIANTIWDTKPAGIATTGDEVEFVDDVDAGSQAVYFSRIADKYIHVNVRYSLYDEEDAPADVAAAIKAQVLSYGEALDVGVDVIQGRIAASIYQNVSGLERVVVRIGSTTSPSDPTPTLNDYIPIDILAAEEANFAEDRISVTTI